jgi:hypothetical protein
MSWSASGQSVISDGSAKEDLVFSPAFESLDPGPKAQAEFALEVIQDAENMSIIDEGKYSVSITGHAPAEGEEGRKSLSISLSAIE